MSCTRPHHHALRQQKWQHSSLSLRSAVLHGWWLLKESPPPRVLNCWVGNVLRRNYRVFPCFCQNPWTLLHTDAWENLKFKTLVLNQINTRLGLGRRETRLCCSPFSSVMPFIMQSLQKLHYPPKVTLPSVRQISCKVYPWYVTRTRETQQGMQCPGKWKDLWLWVSKSSIPRRCWSWGFQCISTPDSYGSLWVPPHLTLPLI